MKKKTVHVRVSEETRLGLQRLIYDMETAVSLGQGKRFWRQEELGTAELIAELLRRELAHRERSKKASRKGTRRRTALTPSDPPPIDPAEGVLTPHPPEERQRKEPYGMTDRYDHDAKAGNDFLEATI